MKTNRKKQNVKRIKPFAIKDCDLIAIATGKRAQNLKEMREQLLTIHQGCIYYHFWGGLLRPKFVDPEYNNDFAAWVSHALHDLKLAERLGVIDPTDFTDIEGLRQELVEVIEQRLDENEFITRARSDQQFHFVRSQIVVFDTHHEIKKPEELVNIIPHLSVGSVFYHFIDARRRTLNGIDDFRAWLSAIGKKYAKLCDRLAELDPYFVTLTELRHQLCSVFGAYFKGTK
ncbi:MAG: DUF5752 family protein [Thermodesulfobacteriota bacterium]